MRKNAKRILSVFLTALMLVAVVIPVHALPVPGTLYETTDFYNSIYTAFLKWKVDHPDSEYPGFHPGGMFGGGASRDELKQKYDSYVATLPATGYTSSGGLIWQATIADIKYFYPSFLADAVQSFDTSKVSFSVSQRGRLSGQQYVQVNVPYHGAYRVCSPFEVKYSFLGEDAKIVVGALSSTDKGQWQNKVVGSFIPVESVLLSGSVNTPTSETLVHYDYVLPSFEIVLDTIVDDSTYNINTRPTSITGGNYGIVGDNGQITKVEDNSTIINETDNTYYNPATGQTAPITNWSYDYSDRSYKVTLESGDTVTVTYGDENITIQEGDTIYNVYYLIDGSGSVTPPCEHDWQKGEATVPTCVRPGSASYVCSKCQQTKTETIPALGHNWQVKQTVTTQYDDTGQLVQEGYTIFECSRCHEQYKSPDGTIPPGGGSGTDPGGEEGETTIGGLIEKLLSGVGSIVGGIIKGLLSLLTKAVEALAGLAELFTTFVGSLVELWGGFTSFLSAVFPFLPEEFIIIIELGLILMIAAAVFRKFIS